MNYEQANRILDRTKDGFQFSEFTVRKALELTGDIDPDGSERMDLEIQEKNTGTWEERSVLLVANHIGRHNQAAGP